MRVVKNEFIDSDIENKIEVESSWVDTHILTNNNKDKTSINYDMAKSFAGKRNHFFSCG